MEIHSLFEGTVRDLSLKGNGVVDHPSGQVFFVPSVWPGDRGRFKIESIEKRYGFARLVELLEPSPDRQTLPCPYHGYGPGKCGGCPWMAGAYPSQLRFKEQMLRHLLERSQVLSENTQILPIWGSDKNLGYRNRAQFKTDGQRLGFISRDSHELAEIEDCVVLTEKNRETLKALRKKLPNPGWRPGSGYRWSYLEIDEDIDADQVIANTRRPFQQGNSEQNQRMKEWVRQKLLDMDKTLPLIELFSGSGNFTKVIAELGFERIVAVEVVESAVEELSAQKLPGVEALALNMYLPGGWNRLKKVIRDAKILFLDPPRDGFREIDGFLKEFKQIGRIFYISCEVSQFARDAARLRKAGWELKEVQPLDQFPHTPHVELLTEFEKRS